MFSNNDRSEELCPGYIRRARSIHTVRFIKFIKNSLFDVHFFFQLNNKTSHTNQEKNIIKAKNAKRLLEESLGIEIKVSELIVLKGFKGIVSYL